MKSITILDSKSLNFLDTLKDETIFVLRDWRQKRVNHEDETELRCECVQLRNISGQRMREIVENINECVIIKIEPS